LPPSRRRGGRDFAVGRKAAKRSIEEKFAVPWRFRTVSFDNINYGSLGPALIPLSDCLMEPYLRGFRYPVIIKESTNLPLGR
jgi:hypothetical protein